MHDYFVPSITHGSLRSGHAVVESWFSDPIRKLWRYESNGIRVRSPIAPNVPGSAIVKTEIYYPAANEEVRFKLTTMPLFRLRQTGKRKTPLPHDEAGLKLWFYDRAVRNGFVPTDLHTRATWTLFSRDEALWQRALAEYFGRIRILDAELFATTLKNGMSGSDRAFGCSLITTQPVVSSTIE